MESTPSLSKKNKKRKLEKANQSVTDAGGDTPSKKAKKEKKEKEELRKEKMKEKWITNETEDAPRKKEKKMEKMKEKKKKKQMANEDKGSGHAATMEKTDEREDAPTKKEKKGKKDKTKDTKKKEKKEKKKEKEGMTKKDEPSCNDGDPAAATKNTVPLTELEKRLKVDRKFSALEGDVSEKTLRAIREEMQFQEMTNIQVLAIPLLLEIWDMVGISKTGSGKTLAFLIPAVELLHKIKFRLYNGTGAIFISPTRELALQTYSVLKKLMKYHSQTHGLLIGGADKKQESHQLMRGVGLLVATPGRLLYHLKNTEHFNYRNVFYFAIDEADRLLDMGFEPQMREILDLLPSANRRQNVLFSATSQKKIVQFGVNINTLREKFVLVTVGNPAEQPTVSGLQQGYCICPTENRFSFLYSFMRRHPDKKIMIFMNTKKAIEFFQLVLNRVYLPAKSVHGGHEQNVRTRTFNQFCKAKKGIMLCTSVAARGLDIPAVDWIIQYDPPEDVQEYIHRVGRTARGEGGQGNAVLILQPQEEGFAHYLQQAKIPLGAFEALPGQVQNLQPQLEALVKGNSVLLKVAKEAYEAYVRSYASHKLKTVFDLEKLDLNSVAKTFGLRTPPHVHLGDGPNKKALYQKWRKGNRHNLHGKWQYGS